MKERRSFSCGCAKIHELPISVFLLSFCLSSLCLSCLSFLSLSRPLPLESRVIASSVVSRRVSPRREESRVIASSVVSRRLSSRCASSRSPCASSELLDVSRVVCGVVSVPSRRASSRWSVSVASCAESCNLELLTSVAVSLFPVQTHRLSSRVVCRLAVRRPAAPSVSRVVCGVVSVSVVSRRASSRCSASVASCAESCRSVSLRCAQSPRRQESRVIRSSVVLRRVCHLVVRRPAARRQSGCALGV